MKKRHLTVSTTAAVLVLALSACTGGSSDSPSASSSEKGAPKTTISHIHGVEIGPSDGKLYVATHEGIYTPDLNGRPELVGDRKDDFMGFTITADGAFLASGHPAPGRDAPGNLGLIESTDGGKTWKDRSLTGEVDFHSLDHAHQTIYGYDSTNGLLRISKDGSSWDQRSKLKALDIAVSPQDANTILATTESGVIRSTDGGKSFGSGSKPVMAFLSWTAPNALYGINPSGELSKSTDGGQTWQKTSTVRGGAPQALTAVTETHLIVASQDGVYESKDGGKNFVRRLDVSSGGDH
ncbi:F510_1955 family glycosylhydrolase [Streptomyces albipurpureus]|uniref:Exo-alpha-sialidase n=1 Tax=Streptomyces albipurpureus TaxID=2897419 RepID=A0ABT0UW50_9ACTN|nr:exo-alpha-sialidase [Streptomyces sp. CWNU-1]MCM2392803.1 exo-alpha-sialidase [Streptomyces sp. CWNU-1]